MTDEDLLSAKATAEPEPAPGREPDAAAAAAAADAADAEPMSTVIQPAPEPEPAPPCNICYGPMDAPNPSRTCFVNCCASCMGRHVGIQIAQRNVADMRCPFLCRCVLTAAEIEEAIISSSSTAAAEIGGRGELLRKYQKDLMLQTNTTARECPRCDRVNMKLPSAAHVLCFKSGSSELIKCSECSTEEEAFSYCYVHGDACAAKGCARFTKELHAQHKTDEKASRALQNSQRRAGRIVDCPNCSVQIEKNSGCPHMSCSNCSHQFWYVSILLSSLLSSLLTCLASAAGSAEVTGAVPRTTRSWRHTRSCGRWCARAPRTWRWWRTGRVGNSTPCAC